MPRSFSLGTVPPLAWLAAFFALLCLPLLLSTQETNYTWDESSYHLPAVRQIHEHWPKLDLAKDSLSATAPGYHYFLAGISYLTGTSRLALRLLNFFLSFGVVALLYRIGSTRLSPWTVIVIVAPLAFSNFFVKSASYLVTDNAALLATTAALSALFFSHSARGTHQGSLLAAASVFIRQSGIWLIAPLACRVLLEPHPVRRMVLVLPPCILLAWLVLTWGGIVPPQWYSLTHVSHGLVPAAGAYIFSVLALFAPAYYLAIHGEGWREDFFSRWTIAGAVVGLSLALAGSNVPDYEAGRWGGYLWELAIRLPIIGAYSPVFLVLSPTGGALLGMLVRRLRQETSTASAALWLTALASWVGTALSNRQLFHRYYEPTLVMLLICWLFLVAHPRTPKAPLTISPLIALAGIQLVLTLLTAHARTFGFL